MPSNARTYSRSARARGGRSRRDPFAELAERAQSFSRSVLMRAGGAAMIVLALAVVVAVVAVVIVVVVFLVDGLHWLIVAAGSSENAEGKERGQQPQRACAHEWCLLDSIRAGNGRMRSQPRWINARESEVLVDRFRRGRRRDEAWSPRRATGRRHGRSRRSHWAAGAALRRRAEPHLGHERRR